MRRGGLYETAAALLLAPTVLARPVLYESGGQVTATTVITLKVPDKKGHDHEAGIEGFTFRLDMGQSNMVRGHVDLEVNGHKISQDGNNHDQGVISVPRRPKSPFEQVLALPEQLLDGEARGGQASPENEHHSTRPLPDFNDELQSQIQELDILRTPSRQLDGLVYAEDMSVVQLDDKKHPMPLFHLYNCESLRCVWEHLAQRVIDAAQMFGGGAKELDDLIAQPHNDVLPTLEDDESEAHDIHGVAPLQEGWVWVDEYPLVPDKMQVSDEVHGYRRCLRRPPPLVTLALAAIALGYFSLWGIHRLHRRSSHLSLDSQQRCTASGHHETRFERCARRNAQKTAARAFVRRMLCRQTHGNSDASEEKRETSSSAAGTEATMEEEIAQLREAASLVGDMVAAEEGRARPTRSAPPPTRIPEHLRDPSHPASVEADEKPELPALL